MIRPEDFKRRTSLSGKPRSSELKRLDRAHEAWFAKGSDQHLDATLGKAYLEWVVLKHASKKRSKRNLDAVVELGADICKLRACKFVRDGLDELYRSVDDDFAAGAAGGNDDFPCFYDSFDAIGGAPGKIEDIIYAVIERGAPIYSQVNKGRGGPASASASVGDPPTIYADVFSINVPEVRGAVGGAPAGRVVRTRSTRRQAQDQIVRRLSTMRFAGEPAINASAGDELAARLARRRQLIGDPDD